jgi:hypothetical protein
MEYDDIKNLFFNVVPDQEDEPEEEEEEKPRKTKGFRKREEVKEEEEEPEEEEEEEPEEEKPRERRRSRKPKEVDTRCPFGHVFGKDYDSFEDCDDCDVWRDCRKENRK